jgi:hypothetical protein
LNRGSSQIRGGYLSKVIGDRIEQIQVVFLANKVSWVALSQGNQGKWQSFYDRFANDKSNGIEQITIN